jgi:hypothetical protein
MPDADDGAADPDLVHYKFEMERDAWRRWTETIPRSVSLADRVRELIREDADATRRGGYDEIEERTARLLGSRLFHRARTAETALEDGDDEKVAAELEEIQKIASMFED